MITFFKLIFLFIFFIYIFYGCTLYFFQENIIFYPVPYNKEEIAYIEKIDPCFRFKKINIDKEILTYWEHKTTSDIVILYFGGNAENTVYTIMELKEHTQILQYNWFLLNYPGYNGSSGKPSEKSFYQSSEWLYQEIQKEFNNKKMILMGRSIGSGVASYLATKVKCDKLILITPFDSIENIAKKFYPIYPTSILLKHKFPSYKYIQNVKIPILILAAEYDEVIPKDSTENLVKFIKNPEFLNYYIIPNTGHNTISDHPMYWEYLDNFIKKSF